MKLFVLCIFYKYSCIIYFKNEKIYIFDYPRKTLKIKNVFSLKRN